MILPELTFRPKLSVVCDEQIQALHLATLEMLEGTGVRISDAEALELLDGAGARVDGQRVRLPAFLVEDAIRTASSRVVLGDRGGRRTLGFAGAMASFGTCLDCIEFLDPATEVRRPFTSADCRTTATVSDALPNFTHVMTLGLADDAPPALADRIIARQVLTYCQKPMVFSCVDVKSLADIHAMALVIAGDEQRFGQAPFIANLGAPISPLGHSDEGLAKLIFCARHNIPQIYIPGIQSGGTAPATMAGTIVMANAETLSGLLIAQLVRPGAPFLVSGFTTVMDMATTVFSYGAPEMDLMVAALAQLAQHYRLPFFGTGGCSDAKYPDPQAAVEAAFSCLSSALSGANMVHDGGILDHGCLVSPAFMVLVNEVLHMVNQYMRGVDVNADTLALAVVDRVGPGGHFLHEDHTMRHFRDVWYSKLFDRSVKDDWLAGGGQRFEERLHRQTLQAMAHRPEPLPDDVLSEFEKMAAGWQ